jgi:ABC-type transport system substrate-binding protein
LLAEAGFTEPVAFTIDVYNTTNPVAAIQVMQQDWTAAGFAPTIQTHDLASFAKILLSKTFDVCLSYEFNGTNWGKSGREPLGVYVTDNFVNFVNYTDPAFDELLASSLAETDPEAQVAIWAEANKMVGEAAVNLIPVVPRLTLAKRSNVTGLPLKPLELSFLRLYEVSIG